MTNNKVYKWFRTCLYLLPFGLLALIMLRTDFTAVTDFGSALGNIFVGILDNLSIPNPFFSVFVNVFSDIFGSTAVPVWFASFLAYYVFIYLVDITLGLLLFLPRWISSKFGGEWLD